MEPRFVYSTTPQRASGVQSLIARIPGATTLGGYLTATATKAVASGSSPAAGAPPDPAPRTVGCLKFEKWPANCSRDGREHVALLIGHAAGFEVWDLGPDGAGHHGLGGGGQGGTSTGALQLAAATTPAPVRGLCLFGGSDANDVRPCLAVSTSAPSLSTLAPQDADSLQKGSNSGSPSWLVRAYNLDNHSFADELNSKESKAAPLQFAVPVHGILGSPEVLLAYAGVAVHGFRASNLQLAFSVPAVPPHPTSAAAASATCLALGPRWLAFPSASAPNSKGSSGSSHRFFSGGSVGDCDAGGRDLSGGFVSSSGDDDGVSSNTSGGGLVGTAQGVVGGLYWLGAKSKRAAGDYLAQRQQQQQLQQQQQQQLNFPSQANTPSQQPTFLESTPLPTLTAEQAVQAAADAAELAWQNHLASLGDAPGTVAFLDISTSLSSSSSSLSPTANVVCRLRAHPCNDPLEAMAWSRCGRSLVTAPRSGQTLHLWAVANDSKSRQHRARRRGKKNTYRSGSGSGNSSSSSTSGASAANASAAASAGSCSTTGVVTAPPPPRFVLVYKLVRGLTPASVRSLALSGLWCAAATSRGTVHLFGVDPRLKGGAVDGRAHTDPPPLSQRNKSSSHQSAAVHATSALSQSPVAGGSGGQGASPSGIDANNAGGHSKNKDKDGLGDVDAESDEDDYDLVSPEEGAAYRSNDDVITPASLASLARVRPLPGDYCPATSSSLVTPGHASSCSSSGHRSNNSGVVVSGSPGAPSPSQSIEPLSSGSSSSEGGDSTTPRTIEAAPADMACWAGGSSLLVVAADGTLRRHTLQPSLVRCAVTTNSSSKTSPQDYGGSFGSGHIHNASNSGSVSSSPGVSTANRGSSAYYYVESHDDDGDQGADGAADDAAALLAGAPLSQRAVGAAAGAAGPLASALAAGGGRLLSSSPSSYSSLVGSLGSSSRGSSINRGSSSARDSPLGRSPNHPSYHQHSNNSHQHHSGKGNSPVLSGSPAPAASNGSGGGGGGLLGSSPLVAALRANFRGTAAPPHRGAVAYKTRLALEVGDVSEWALWPPPRPSPQRDSLSKPAILNTAAASTPSTAHSVSSGGAGSGGGDANSGVDNSAPMSRHNSNSSSSSSNNERDWLSLIERRTRPPSVPLWASPQLSYMSVADRSKSSHKTTTTADPRVRVDGSCISAGSTTSSSSSSNPNACPSATDCNPFRFEDRGKPSAVKLSAPPAKPRRGPPKASPSLHSPPTPPLRASSPGPEMQFALTDDEDDERENIGNDSSSSGGASRMPLPTPGSPQGQAFSAWETVSYDT